MLPYLIDQMQKSKMSNPVTFTGNVTSLPSTGIENGQLSDVRVLGNTVTNILGSKGDCETTNIFDGTTSSIFSLDSSDKVFGSNSIIQTTNVATGGFGGYFTPKIELTKYYFASVYVKNINAVNVRIRILDGITQKKDSDVITSTSWTRLGCILQPSDLTGITDFKFLVRGETNAVGQQFKTDGFMFIEITAADYALGVTALLAKYNYVNDTKSTLSGRFKAICKNLQPLDFIAGKYYNTSGVLIVDTGAFYSPSYITVNPGSTYTLGISGVKVNNWAEMMFYDNNKNFITGYHQFNNPTFTVPSNAKYAKVSYFNGGVMGNPQVELGSTVTTYVPYTDTTAYTPNGIALRSLPNGVNDEYNVTTGELKQNLNQIVLNGSENWSPQTLNDTTNYLAFKLAIADGLNTDTDKKTITSDKFSWASGYSLIAGTMEGISQGSYWSASACIVISILKSKLSTQDVAGFKTWLVNNPVSCIYQLIQPVITKYPPQTLLVGANYSLVYEPYSQEIKVTNGEGILLKNPAKSIESIKRINGETKVDIASTDISVYRLNSTLTATTNTTTTTIKITGHGLSANDKICNTSRSNAVRKVLTVPDADTITVNEIVGMASGDTIQTFKTTVTDTQKTAIVSVANSVSGQEYEIVYELNSENSTLPTIQYSYPMNTKAVLEQNTKQIAVNTAMIREIILSSLR